MPGEVSALYLLGVLAYLEGRFGVQCWKGIGQTQPYGPHDPIEEIEFDTLHAIRNAVTHNDRDIEQNRADVTQEQRKVIAGWSGASLIGYGPDETRVTLSMDFLEVVRVRFLSLFNHLTNTTP